MDSIRPWRIVARAPSFPNNTAAGEYPIVLRRLLSYIYKMKTSDAVSKRTKNMNITHSSLRYLMTTLAVFGTCFVLDRAGFCAEPPDAGDDQGTEVLTRGP